MRTLDALRRLTAGALAMIVLAAGLAPAPAQASGTIRSFAQRYSYTGRTTSYLVGNQLLNCPVGAANCTTARNGAGNNNDFTMEYVDVDSNPSTFNSSTAPLTVPAGASVLRAYLYWGGDTSAGTSGAAAPTPANNNRVLFSAAGGAYTTVTAATLDVTGSRFSGIADVTSLVSAAGSGTYGVANLQAGTGGDRYGGWGLIVIFRDPSQPLRSVTLFDGSLNINTTAPTSVTTTVSGFRTPATGLVGARIGLIAFEGDNNFTGDQFLVNGAQLSDALNPATNVFNSTNSRLGVEQTGRAPQQSNMLGFDVDYISVAEGVINNNDTSASLTFTTTSETYYPIALLFVTNVYEPEIVTNFTKSATDLNGGQFRPGDVVSYAINLSNTGEDSSDVTVISDPLPIGVTYVPGSLEIVSGPNAGAKTDAAGDDQADYNPATRTVTYRVGVGASASAGGRIAPVPQADSSTSVRFRAVIDANQSNGSGLSNVAGVNYVGATSGVPGSGSTQPAAFAVSRDADLSITNTGPASVNGGAPVTYVVTVASAGPDAADGATVTDNVPAALSGVSITCSSSGGAVCPSTTGLTTLSGLALPTMPAGGTVAFTITGTAPTTTTTLSNTASVSAPAGTADPTPGNNTAGPVITTIEGAADLAVTASLVNPPPVLTGQTVTYSITVANNGPGAVAGAPVSVTAPSQLSGVSWTCAPAVACGPASGTGDPAPSAMLASGASLTITLSGTAPGTTPTTLDALSATVAAPPGQTDPDTTNNSATVPATTVSPQAIVATDDAAGPVNGRTGTGSAVDVLANDSLGGVAAGVGNVTLAQLSSAHPNVVLDPASGAVIVAGSTPAGSYGLVYQICQTSDPGNCATATATITVAAAPVAATDDASAQVNGASGGVALANVLANDSLDGTAPTTGNVSLSVVTPATVPGVVLDITTGAVGVAAGTPAGSYPLTYRICEQLNPANCATATATANVGAAAIAAGDDAGSIGGAAGGTAIAGVLANDSLNGATATSAAVSLIQVSTTSPNVVLVTATGAVTVAAGTPAGSYTVAYQVCERLNLSNCTAADAVVTVTAAALAAGADTGSVVGSTGGPVVANVLANDSLDGVAPTLAQVVLTQVATSDPAVALDPATGAITVAPATPAGTYTVDYRMCERLNPANCTTATVTVTVTAAPIDAVDDTTVPVDGVAGSADAANVLANDTLGGTSASLAQLTLAQVSSTSPTVSLDVATGRIAVAAGTPAGIQTLVYRVCEQLNQANCDTATVAVNVVAPALTASADTGTTPQNTAVVLGVLGNDTMAGGAVAASAVTVSIVGGPAHGTATVDADGRVVYTPAANYSGTDAFTYRVCDRVNPTVCADATVSLTVTANSVDAVDETLATPQTGPVVIDPMARTRTGGGAALDPASVRIVDAPANGTAVVNADGTITYTPNRLFFGTETFSYRICDLSTPVPVCDVARVTVTVAMQAPQLRVSKTVASRPVRVGDLVRYTVLVENTGIAPANGATVVDVPPAGFTLVEGSLRVDDADGRFALLSASPIRIGGIDVPVGGRATVLYLLRVGAGVGRGTHTNRVSATDASGTTVSNTSAADVTVEGDPMTGDSLLLGSVFDDRNGNGVQDDGERGIPGVRIATVEGLLMETDGSGRFHLEGVDAGERMRGRNVILKVDAATLPPGATFTTENPRVRRVTPGLPVRFDFGVRLPAGPDAPLPPATQHDPKAGSGEGIR